MIRHLVLLGVGPGHWRFLQGLLKRRGADIAITLVTRQERYISRGALLRAVAGHLPMEDCGLPIEPLLRRVNVNWLDHNVKAVDADTKVLLLDDGRELRFDWLSCEPEPLFDRTQAETFLPGARANGFFTRPAEAFCKLWPRVARLAVERPLRVAVICGGTEGVHWPRQKFAIELAFAVREAFAGSAVTLVTGGDTVASATSGALRSQVQGALRRQGITVLADGAVGIATQEVALRSGARLACDVPLLALAPQAAAFVSTSGLALDAGGFIALDGAQRSVSHSHVFASQFRSASTAPALAASLKAVMDGKPPSPSSTLKNGDATRTLQRVRCGKGQTIVSWRNWAWTSWLALVFNRTPSS